MSISKKLTALVSIILCLAILLCACGKNSDTDKDTSKKPTSDDTSDVSSGEETQDPSDEEEDWGDEEEEDWGDDEEEDWDDEDWEDEEEWDDFETVYADVGIDLSKPLSESYVNSALYLGWGYFPDAAGRTYTKKEITSELDRIVKMGYTHVRTSLTTGWLSSGYDNTAKDWKWDGEEFQRFVWVCKELEKRGITLTMTVNWDMETDLKSKGIYVADDYEATCKNYAEYAYRMLTKLKENGVNNITQLIPFCEPYPSKQLSVFTDKYTNEIWRDTVKALHEKLTAEGIRKDFKILANCTTVAHIESETLNALGFTQKEWAEWIVKNCDSFIDIYAFHNYSNFSNNIYEDTYQYYYDSIVDAMEVFKSTGKPVCFDEYGYSYNETVENQESTYSRYLTRNIPFQATQNIAGLIAIINSGADIAMKWSLFDTIFPDSTVTNTAFDGGIQVTGVAPVMNESSIPYYGYYAHSLVSRYFSSASGTKTYMGIDDGDGVYLVASRQSDGDFTVLAVNLNVSEAEVTFNFSESLSNATLYRHLYDPATVNRTTAANIIGVDKVYKNVIDSFTDTLPAGAVVVYTTNAN